MNRLSPIARKSSLPRRTENPSSRRTVPSRSRHQCSPPARLKVRNGMVIRRLPVGVSVYLAICRWSFPRRLVVRGIVLFHLPLDKAAVGSAANCTSQCGLEKFAWLTLTSPVPGSSFHQGHKVRRVAHLDRYPANNRPRCFRPSPRALRWRLDISACAVSDLDA